ncbi:regulator of nonsense transcripts 3B-like [Macrosteles quadrilineatus]|uniref:regulator of nonsense transcripts 3B-like n=1 Tax=Macrosteles quadrilineatus TaxID=74068 RepID=UPI0023E151E1|nr:regulator of nonsense transcripts 3B-like [Macrosteles quadrilineatus]
MAKKKPMSNEERLRRKKECEKRRRERIKLSAEATEALKKQKHDIYVRLKNQGKVKMINQMTRREKKERRKRWNINTQNRRTRIKAAQEAEGWNTPPETDNEDNPDVVINHQEPTRDNNKLVAGPIQDHSPELRGQCSRQNNSGRKRVRRDRSAAYREISKLKIEIKRPKKSKEKYKKRFYRAENKRRATPNEDTTPRKKVKEIIKRNGSVNTELKVDKIYVLPIEEKFILEEGQFLQENVSKRHYVSTPSLLVKRK